ncbi:MAG TPA: lipoyl synthase [Candidatus Omnitrophota bacterium]|nr:lipoyl synthase [Candidatus Omnitrophota bacterium]HPD84218.1 lipoyl synthase [Candidatus Omnitrophota bacterium]HRZ03074.1 lipoyl synthase [Candidatus Omnitrophota bacterium]
MPTEASALASISLPPWFKQQIPDAQHIERMHRLLKAGDLATVCEGAHCPNLGECWARGTATFMILGNICTRACRFCAVKNGTPLEIDEQEPHAVAAAVKKLNLRYVVVTSVTRDDLPDAGAGHFAQTIQEIRAQNPQAKIEVLIPDLGGKIENLKIMADQAPEVIGHNLETVSRLTKSVRPAADYRRSLRILESIKDLASGILVKSGFMVGLGETHEEIIELMRDLRDAGCDILTIGQYLAPSKTERHFAVKRFLEPKEFEDYRLMALNLGFKYVASAPLVRSSYKAEEAYQAACRSVNRV